MALAINAVNASYATMTTEKRSAKRGGFRRRVILRLAFTLCSAITMASCSANSSTAPPLSRPAWWRDAPAAIRVGVYVGQAGYNSVIFGYRARNKSNGAPECSIGYQNFAQSQIAVDASGNVYSPDFRTGDTNIYGPNCGSLIASVNDPYGSDFDVAVGENGTFYGVGGTHVSVCTLSGCTSELTDSSIKQLGTAAVDAQGTVWASYYNQSGVPSLIAWTPRGDVQVMNGYVNRNTPGDLMFDKRGRLVSLQTGFFKVYVYKCDVYEATCFKPKAFRLKAASLFGSLNAANTDFQATDYANDSVDVYSWPRLEYKYSYSRGLNASYGVQGIAQVP
jgi:hypothetical protein